MYVSGYSRQGDGWHQVLIGSPIWTRTREHSNLTAYIFWHISIKGFCCYVVSRIFLAPVLLERGNGMPFFLRGAALFIPSSPLAIKVVGALSQLMRQTVPAYPAFLPPTLR